MFCKFLTLSFPYLVYSVALKWGLINNYWISQDRWGHDNSTWTPEPTVVTRGNVLFVLSPALGSFEGSLGSAPCSCREHSWCRVWHPIATQRGHVTIRATLQVTRGDLGRSHCLAWGSLPFTYIGRNLPEGLAWWREDKEGKMELTFSSRSSLFCSWSWRVRILRANSNREIKSFLPDSSVLEFKKKKKVQKILIALSHQK